MENDITENWHWKIRDVSPCFLTEIIEKLEKKYKCSKDIEDILKDIENRKKNSGFNATFRIDKELSHR